jgi:hypothetical protein
MEWYEIIIGIVIIPVGAYIRGNIYEFRRNYYKNDSWKGRGRSE